VDRVHGAVDRGQRARRRLADVRRAGAGAHRCSPVMEGEDESVEAVLGRCSPVTEEWQRGGTPEATNGGGLSSSRGAEEGMKKLRRDVMRCGESRGGLIALL
jgi:hypothetical protein